MSDTILKMHGAEGVFYAPPLKRPAVEAEAAKGRYTFLSANIAEHASLSEVLTELGAALEFPIWYGANFDALMDCLSDPDWLPAKGHVIWISGIARLRTADPKAFVTLIEVFKAAVEARRAQQHPFWILIDAPARGIATLPEA